MRKAPTGANNRPILNENGRLVQPNFITKVIDQELRAGLRDQIVTRFPPEPNGFLHIGHGMAILLNFGVAQDYNGYANLRFDDTNPETEDSQFVKAMQEDMRWLGCHWENVLFTSDYFEQLYGLAVRLIKQGQAYVDDLSEEEIREYRGSVTVPGRQSPHRTRSIPENLDVFKKMKDGEFKEGSRVLRARINMAAPNMIMRDPILYRIVKKPHFRTGDKWHIYPMYDFAHPLSDALEGVTHSLCSLEFENNRELYDWLVEALFEVPRPHQYEFARLNLEYTVTSKRRLAPLVADGHVSGWDDPRMPTLAALRRRGVTPEAVKDFVNRAGVTKANSVTDLGLLEYAIRDDLNRRAPRMLAVTEPLKVIITNYPEGKIESLDAPYWPHDIPNEGSRALQFNSELLIERNDFSTNPPEDWRRLSVGTEVRLRHAYVIHCYEIIEDDEGNTVELRCTYDPDTLGANPTDRKIAGTIHWLTAATAVPAEFQLYDRLFQVPVPGTEGRTLVEDLNPLSLEIRNGFVEPSVRDHPVETRYQFERLGYFWHDPHHSPSNGLVFNRIITLRDNWSAKRSNQKTIKVTTPTKMSGHKSSSGRSEKQDSSKSLSSDQLVRFEQYVNLGLSKAVASLIATTDDLADFYDSCVTEGHDATSVGNWMVNELVRIAKKVPLGDLPFGPTEFTRLVALADSNTISSRAAKEILEAMLMGEGEPDRIVEARGLTQVSDKDKLELTLTAVLAANPSKVAEYRNGKRGLLGFFMGQIMRETQGTANPQLTKELLKKRLDNS
jgi:glutaminyl-tRNA synthetase